MATEAHIPAPICETIRELGEDTNNSINEPSTVESGDFLKPPLIGEIHCEVNYTSPEASKVTEKPDQTVKDDSENLLLGNLKLDDHPEVPGKQLESAANEIHGDVGNPSKTLEDIITNDTNLKFSEKTNDNESAVIDKVKDENEDLSRAGLLETEKNISTLLKEDMHVIPENREASNLSQENERTCSSEEGSTNVNLHGLTSDATEEKTIEADVTKEEVLESFPTIVSSSPDDGSTNAVLQGVTPDSKDEKTIDKIDIQKVVLEVQNISTTGSNEESEEKPVVEVGGSETKIEELLEKESEKTFSSQPLTRESSDNESMVMNEAGTVDGELRKAEHSEIEKCTESTFLKEDVQTEKPVESLHLTPENRKTLDQDNETTSSSNEQSTIVDLHGITRDFIEEKTIDAVDTQKEVLESFSIIVSSSPEEGSNNTIQQGVTSDNTDEKTIDENFSRVGSIEETEEKSSIKVDGSETKIEELLEKESEKSSLPQPLAREASDNEAQTEDGELRTAEQCEIEKCKESTLLKTESNIEKPEESLDVISEDTKASDSGHEQETSSFEEQSAIAHPQVILVGETDDKPLDVAETKDEILEVQNVHTIVSNEKPEENSLIHADGPQRIDEERLEKDSEKLSLINDLGQVIETKSFEEQCATGHSQIILDQKTEATALDAAETEEETPVIQNVSTTISNEKTEVIQVDSPQKENEEHLEKDSEQSSLIKELGQQIETSSSKEQSEIGNSQIILDPKIEDEALDATETKVETLKNVQTIVSNEKMDGNSLIQLDAPEKQNEENLEKDSEKPSLIKDIIVNANEDESTVTDEVKLADVNGTEQSEEKNIECDLTKEELHTEKPVQSFLADPKENKAPDLAPHTETTCFIEDQSLTEKPQEVPCDKTEETTDAADTETKTQEQQNIEINVSNEDCDKNSSIQVDTSQMQHETILEKEIENSPLKEASTEDTNAESIIMHEAEIGNECISSENNIDSTLLKKENLQEAPEDHKPSASSEDIVTTCSLDEQSLTANPQSIMSDETIEATDTKQVNPENVAPNISQEHAEKNSQMQHEEHLKNENENSSSTESLVEEINDNQSKDMHEPKDKGAYLVEAEFLEKESDIVSTSVKEEQVECELEEEAQVEKHTDTLQQAPDDIKVSDSTHDTKMSSDKEEISNDKTEETVGDASDTKALELQDIETNILDGDRENNSLVEEGGSQKPSVKEVSMLYADDNVSAIIHEAKFVDEHLIKADLLGKENIECALENEEEPTESMQVAVEDIKAPAIVQDREISSLEEQSFTTNPQGIIGDNKEDKTNYATYTKEETHADKTVATTTTGEDTQENSPVQLDDSQLERNEHLANESEITPLTASRDATENTLAREEVETSSIKEQILIADPQEIASDKTEEQTIDATYTMEKSLEDVARNVPNQDSEDDIPIKEHGSEKPDLREASIGNTNDDESTIRHEVKLEDENLQEANLSEDEKKLECTSVEKEAFTESLHEADKDIKACDSCKDGETTSREEQGLTANLQTIVGDEKEDGTSDATDLKEETTENKNAQTTIPQEDTAENSPSQVECSKLEQKEHLERRSENADDSTGDTIQNTLKEEAPVEKPIEHFQESTGDIKASSSNQDTDIKSIEDQIPTADPQEISCDKTEEKTFDADNVTIVPNSDNEVNPPIEVCGSKEPSLIEASSGNSNDVESPIMHVAKSEEKNLIKADLVDKEDTLVDEKVPIDSILVEAEEIESASSQERETSSLEVQSRTTNSQEIVSHFKDDKIVDGTELEEETSQDKQNIAKTIPYEDTEEISLIQADCSPIELGEYSGKKSEKPSSQEAQTEDTPESALSKEEYEMEKLIDSLQVATEDIKASSSSQDTETSFIKEQTIPVDPQEISCEATKEEIVDVTDMKEEAIEVQENATNVPTGDREEISPTTADGSETPPLTDASTGNTTEVQGVAIKIPSGDNEDNSPPKVESSQLPSSTEASTGNTTDHEPTIKYEPKIVDESFIEDGLIENEKDTDGTLIKEELSIEPVQVTEDIKASASGQDREKNSLEEQSLIANYEAVDETDLKEETSEEKGSKSTAVEIPSTKDLEVNTDKAVDTTEDPTCKQEESSITTASEEHTTKSNEHFANVTRSASEPSEIESDHKVVGEANENLVETDPKESTKADAQAPNEEKQAEIIPQDNKDIKEELVIATSQDVLESTGLNCEEERIILNKHDIPDSSNSVELEEISSSIVASEKDSTSNLSQESTSATQLEAENEDAQKQAENLQVSAILHDSSEKVEKGVELCRLSATDSEITQEMQKLEEASIPAPDDNIIQNTGCNESEVVADANDQKLTEREQEETECKQEKVLLDETVVEIKEPTAIPNANDFLPKSFTETSEVDHSTDERQLTPNRENLQKGETCTGDDEETKSDKYKEDTSETDGSTKPAAHLEAKIDDEIPEIIEKAPRATEGQEVESTSVGETSTLISQSETDNHEHAYIGTMEKSDSNEVKFEPEESQSGNEAKTQVLESIGHVQSYGIISKAEDNLEAAAEIKSETATVEDIFEPKETTQVNISSEKIKEEDEDIKNDHLDSCKEEAITESQTNTEETCEVITTANETEKVSKVSEEADDKAVEKGESVEEVTSTGSHDSREEVNSSTVAFLEDEEKTTIADDVDNEMAKDEGLPNQNSNTSVKAEGSGEQPKTVEENVNAVIMQHQDEYDKINNETDPHPEFAQGKESEKQDQNDDTCSLDEVQKKDEVNLMLSAEKGEEEANKADTWSKPTEDEDKNTYVEAENVDSSSLTQDTTKVSDVEGVHDVPEETKISTTEERYSEDQCPNENMEYQISSVSENIELLEHASKAGSDFIAVPAEVTEEDKKVKEVIDTYVKAEGSGEQPKTIEENVNAVIMQHRDEDDKINNESDPHPEFAQGKESEKQDKNDETCSLDEVQKKDEVNLMLSAEKCEEETSKADTWSKPSEDEDKNTYVEAEKVDSSSHTEDTTEVSHDRGVHDVPEETESSTTERYSEDKCPDENLESQISTVSEKIELIEHASKAGCDFDAVPAEVTGEDKKVEEIDNCKGMENTSTTTDPTNSPTSKIMSAFAVGTSLEANDQPTDLHDLPQESNVREFEVTMVQRDGPFDLQNATELKEDLQELNEGTVEVSNKENQAEANPNENLETKVPGGETVEPEVEEQTGVTSEAVTNEKEEVNSQAEKIKDDYCDDEIKISSSAESDKINVQQSSTVDTAQSDKNEESQRQIESLPVLPVINYTEVAEKDLPIGLDGSGVTEVNTTPLPSKDKHVVLEADDAKNLNPEDTIGNKNLLAIEHGSFTECSPGKHEEKTSQETTKSTEESESKEKDKGSLSHHLQVSNKEPTIHVEDLHATKTDETEHEDAKTDEEHDDDVETSEQQRSESSSDAPVMVDMGDADVKVAHKKSHNILSGVGSKMKHSIAKVKKAITGKSSHPKPPSPK